MMMSVQVDMPSSLVPRLHCISYKRYNSVQHPYVGEKCKFLRTIYDLSYSTTCIYGTATAPWYHQKYFKCTSW